MTSKKRPLASSNSARGNDRSTNNHEGESTLKDLTTVPVSPSAGKNRVTRKTLAREVFALWLAGDTAILGECEEFHNAWKLTPEALKIAARLAAKK